LCRMAVRRRWSGCMGRTFFGIGVCESVRLDTLFASNSCPMNLS
jgi:hypothetical protein